MADKQNTLSQNVQNEGRLFFILHILPLDVQMTQTNAPGSQHDPQLQAKGSRKPVRTTQTAVLDNKLKGGLTGLQRRDLIFEHITGFGASTAEKMILGEIPAGGPIRDQTPACPEKATQASRVSAERDAGITVKRLADRLAEVFGLQKAQAAAMMGVSESTVSRHTRPNTDVLDRTLLASQVFADVSDVLGSENAQRWFSTPNAALDHRTPLKLLSSRLGEKKVQQVIGALLDGAYL